MALALRPYASVDRSACLRLFDANTPAFFLPEERPAFEARLDGEDGSGEYVVIEDGAEVIACGGVWVEGERGGFTWGMVHPTRQGQGLGTRLAEYRLERLRALGVREAVLDTTQNTEGYYARFGFREVRRTPGGYGPGMDRVDMALRLG